MEHLYALFWLGVFVDIPSGYSNWWSTSHIYDHCFWVCFSRPQSDSMVFLQITRIYESSKTDSCEHMVGEAGFAGRASKRKRPPETKLHPKTRTIGLPSSVCHAIFTPKVMTQPFRKAPSFHQTTDQPHTWTSNGLYIYKNKQDGWAECLRFKLWVFWALTQQARDTTNVRWTFYSCVLLEIKKQK